MDDKTEETYLLEKCYGNNEQPTLQELERISFYASGPRDKLAAIDIEIQALETRLESLRASRKELTDRIVKHRSISSIVRRLPNDILGEIFMRCLPENRLPALYVQDAPLLLTIISRRWREVALGLPQLWAAAHVAIRNYKLYSSNDSTPTEIAAQEERPRAMIELFFSRAGALPLKLSLSAIIRYGDYKAVSPAWEWVTTSLFPRVHLLELSGISRPGKQYLMTIPVERFARLQTVRFYLTKDADEADDILDHQYLRAPGLREVDISYRGFDPSTLPLQWGQLTHLFLQGDYDPIPLATAILMLQKCPQLARCALSVRGICKWRESGTQSRPSQVAIEDRVILLPFLETLNLFHLCHIEELTRQLYVPKLTALRLIFDNDDEHIGMTHRSIALPNFIIYHPYCLASLIKLEMDFSHYPTDVIIEGLQNLPNLRHLIVADSSSSFRLDNDGFQESILRFMTPRTYTDQDEDSPRATSLNLECVCPRLERFELREQELWRWNRHITLSTLIPFITEKWVFSQRYPGVVTRLTHLTVPAQTMPLGAKLMPDQNVKRALRMCRKEMGLKLEIANPYFDAEKQAQQLEGISVLG